MKQIISFALLLSCGFARGQLYIEKNAGLFLGDGSSIHVQGDIISYHAITGNGPLVMDGEQLQVINLHGYGIDNFEVNNRSGIELAGNIAILKSLKLTGGNVRLASYNLNISGKTKIENAATFGIESNERGVVRVNVSNDLNNFLIPYVSRGIYTPLSISSTGRYQSAYVEISSGSFRGNLPHDATDHVDYAWKIERRGIDGTVDADIDVSRFEAAHGSGAPMQLYSRTGTEWNLVYEAREMRSLKKGKVGSTATEFVLMKRKGTGLDFSLSPNPAKDFTRVSISGAADGKAILTIMDSRGNIVRAQPVQVFKGDNIFQVNVAGVAKGTYHAILLHKGQSTTVKFVKD